jgi:hypothetical protein
MPLTTDNNQQMYDSLGFLVTTVGRIPMKYSRVSIAALSLALAIGLVAPATGRADFAIRQASGVDCNPSVAYNSQTHEYLVVWVEASSSGMGPLMGRRVTESGTVTGSAITIASIAWGKTSVAYNPAQNQFLVVYVTGILPDSGINGQLIDGSGAKAGSSVQLMNQAGHPKILYNSIAQTYLLLGLRGDLYSRKIGGNGQPLDTARHVTHEPTLDYSKYAAAYAPVTATATPTGRYLVATYPVNLMMLDSDGKPLITLYDNTSPYDYWIPFETGSPSGGHYDVDIAYGDTSGYSMSGKAFLIVWSDRDNKWNGNQWDGIWGGYVDAEKTDYQKYGVYQDNSFPIAYIYHYNSSFYAKTWKPAVAFNPVARKFQVAWRETPTTNSSNDTKVNHIRAAAGFFAMPTYDNTVLSATSGTEDPTTPAIAVSTTSASALAVWDDLRNQSTTDHDIYGSLYDITPLTPAALIVTNTNDCGPGSLRQAILEANLTAEADSIAFAIPKSDFGYQPLTGVWTIKPTSPLPDIVSNGTLIDGLSQIAFSGDTSRPGPKIELDGTFAGSGVNGLMIRSWFNRIWALAINRFDGNGIVIAGPAAGGNIVTRSCVGVTPDGMAKAPNLDAGIRIIQSPLNFIGFFDTTSANIIGGNGNAGIAITGAASRFNVVLINCIGTNLSHTANVGNTGDGIVFSDSANDNAVTGYLFPNHVVVANNGFAGIHVDGNGTVRNLLAAGSIYDNGGPGIALVNGGNAMKASPVITNVTATHINGTAAPHDMIYLYNDVADEGREYFATVFADAAGHFSWSGSAKGPHVTALAVDTTVGTSVNNTSAFSAPFIPTGIGGGSESVVPSRFELAQNYPNPFNPTTIISYQLPVTSMVRLVVHDLLGRVVATLVNQKKEPGRYQEEFDGSRISSGVYICTLVTDEYTACKRMILVK